jgi:hypothetical protein
MSWWVYSSAPEGGCFGPASDELVKQWLDNGGQPIYMKYHGYTQKVVLRQMSDAQRGAYIQELHTRSYQKAKR